LRLLRYPTFDASSEKERVAVAEAIQAQVIDDLLMNVLFGRLQAHDVSIFLQGTGIEGLLLAILNEIACNGFWNYPELGRSLDMKPTTLRPRVQTLLAAGMLAQKPQGSLFAATPRAGIFLRICSLMARELISAELVFVLSKLDLGSEAKHAPLPQRLDELIQIPYSPMGKRLRLVWEIQAAVKYFSVLLAPTDYRLVDPQDSEEHWVGR
jgi:hypothetical protein